MPRQRSQRSSSHLWEPSSLGQSACKRHCRLALRSGPAPTWSTPDLARVIDSIRAIDNHAHPVLPPSVDPHDRNFDALPVDNMAPETDTVAWRPDNPQLAASVVRALGRHRHASNQRLAWRSNPTAGRALPHPGP